MLPGLRKRTINFADVVLYFAIALKHVRLMILLMCLSLCMGLLYFVYVKPVYSARSLVRFHSLERPMDAEKVFRDSSEREILLRLTAPHIVQRTARRLGLPDNPKLIYGNYLKAVVARFNSERNIEVDAFAYSGQLVTVWTETMLQEFLKDREEKRFELREAILKAYTEEMKQVARRMEEALQSKYEFQSGRKTEIKVRLDQLSQLPREIAEVSERLATLERIKSTLGDTNMEAVARLSLLGAILKHSVLRPGDIVGQGGAEAAVAGGGHAPGGAMVVVVPPMLTSPSSQRWEELDRERERLKLAMAEASQKYLPAHPRMAEIKKQLDDVEEAIEADVLAAQKHYALEYASLQEKKQELVAKLPAYEKALQESEKFNQDVQMQGAGKLSYETFYIEMAKKISMLDFGADKERTHLQYMGHLELRNNVPISPNRFKLVLFAFGFGMILAIGVPFLIEFLDHTVTNVEEIEQNHRLRGLGIVPRLEPNQLPGYPSIDSKGNPDRQLLENFRVIRTNLLSMGAVTKNPQAIVIASAMPEEGKTVVSYNLAQSFAQMGEKTLLVDADLRRGRLHRIFNYRSAPGLSNVLVQDLDWREVVRATDRENLMLMTCGKHLEGATELIGSPAFERLLQEFRQEFKRIIIDTPPVLGLSETAMLQRLVDGVILVVWCGRTPSRYVKSAVEILQANHANFYGFVLNRLDLNVTSNYYNYYNYYYYSYHYYKSYKALENPPPTAPVQST